MIEPISPDLQIFFLSSSVKELFLVRSFDPTTRWAQRSQSRMWHPRLASKGRRVQWLPSKRGSTVGIQDATAGGQVGKDQLPEDRPERVGVLTSEGNGDRVEGPESRPEEGEPDPRLWVCANWKYFGTSGEYIQKWCRDVRGSDSSSIFSTSQT